MARRNSPARGTSPKKDRIIQLLAQGEASTAIIAKEVGCERNYVFVVKRELLRSQKA
jgi:transposase-like protein